MNVEVKLPIVSPQPHTHLAFEGCQHAKAHGRGTACDDRVPRALFQEDPDLGDIDVLTRLAAEAGARNGFRESLEERRCREARQQALQGACDLGMQSVPTPGIGGYALPGVQSEDVVHRAINTAMPVRSQES